LSGTEHDLPPYFKCTAPQRSTMPYLRGLLSIRNLLTGAASLKNFYQAPPLQQWSIGIYVGTSPFQFMPPASGQNPVLTATDITDIPAAFVADPFMLREGNTWYMFFEVLNIKTRQGEIGLAMSRDGFTWAYKQIVLKEPFHLSYPYVFKWQNTYYMIPETRQVKTIRLYKATNFPIEWSFLRTLLSGGDYGDSSFVYFGERWWLFTSPVANDMLHLYHANDLFGPWVEHPQSPIIILNNQIARPGGRVLRFGEHLIRYAQDVALRYGHQLRAFEIIELTPERYQEKLAPGNPILTASSQGWNAHGMHHIDPHQLGDNQWIACVDGLHEEQAINPRTIWAVLRKRK
jgi:hypothetical protein